MLEINNLNVNYGHVTALTGASIVVPDGKVVTIVGSNGAGKSTMLNTISGVVKKTSGTILLDGKPLPTESYKVVKAGIVQVPEGRRIFPGLTVQENLKIGAVLTDKSTLKDRMEQMYEMFPILAERRRQHAGTFSGGEQQMLAIARGLMAEPKILMMDEPSLGLAPIIVEQVFELIRRIKREMGITVLLVEQNAHQALGVADYAYVLENGAITMEGTGSEIANNDQVKAAYLGE